MIDALSVLRRRTWNLLVGFLLSHPRARCTSPSLDQKRLWSSQISTIPTSHLLLLAVWNWVICGKRTTTPIIMWLWLWAWICNAIVVCSSLVTLPGPWFTDSHGLNYMNILDWHRGPTTLFPISSQLHLNCPALVPPCLFSLVELKFWISFLFKINFYIFLNYYNMLMSKIDWLRLTS